VGLEHIAPHDLRRTCAKLCHSNGGELEQIQFLLGHASVLTTERYLGCKQNLGHPVNDLFDLRIDAPADEGTASDGPEPAPRKPRGKRSDASATILNMSGSQGEVERNDPELRNWTPARRLALLRCNANHPESENFDMKFVTEFYERAV